LHPLAVVLTTVGSGGFAASIILFGNRPFLLVTAMAFCIILSHYGNEISERAQGKQSSDRKEESAVREAASDRNGGTQSERMTLGFIAVAAIGLGYTSFVYMLAKEGRQRARLESEVAVARKIQQTLLPGEGVTSSWFEAAGDTVPATEVGGDFFDYLELSGERLAIVAADVAGHGVGAGILSAMTKSAFRAEAMHDPSPSTVLRRLNAILYDLTERKMFVTMAYVLVDRRTATARIATAGHPPVLRWRAGNGVGRPSVALSPSGGRSAAFAEFRTPNLALGMRRDTEFSEETVPVRPDDMFIIYTDGVIEGLSPNGEQFGAQRLGDAIEDQGSGSAATIARQVVSRFLAFTGSAEERDDATLAVAKVTDVG
jgi:sigma-B regulation protein RsbU (phosphoserine phosphatase)